MQPTIDSYIYSLKDLAILLVKDQGIHEGRYEATFEFQVMVGAMNFPEQDNQDGSIFPKKTFPGVMSAVSNVGLRRTEIINDFTVDAAIVNPAPPAKKVKSTKKGSAE